MTIHGGGTPLSLTEISTEFPDAIPHSMSEFLRGGLGKVPNVVPINATVPTATTGGIRFSNYWNTANVSAKFYYDSAATQPIKAILTNTLGLPNGNTLGFVDSYFIKTSSTGVQTYTKYPYIAAAPYGKTPVIGIGKHYYDSSLTALYLTSTSKYNSSVDTTSSYISSLGPDSGTVAWTTRLYSNTGDINLTGVTSGRIAIGGIRVSSALVPYTGTNYSKPYIVGFGVTGTILWQKVIYHYGGENAQGDIVGACVGSGFLYLLISCSSNFSGTLGMLVKVNMSSGAIAFQKYLKDIGTNSGVFPTSLDIDSSGNLYIGGYVYDAVNAPIGPRPYVMSTDSNGNIRWSKIFLYTGNLTNEAKVANISVNSSTGTMLVSVYHSYTSPSISSHNNIHKLSNINGTNLESKVISATGSTTAMPLSIADIYGNINYSILLAGTGYSQKVSFKFTRGFFNKTFSAIMGAITPTISIADSTFFTPTTAQAQCLDVTSLTAHPVSITSNTETITILDGSASLPNANVIDF